MAIRLNIKTKLLILVLPLSLLPIIILGYLIYTDGKSIIISQKGQLLKDTASSTIDKIDFLLKNAFNDTITWAGMGQMEDVLTDDADGRIQATLERLKAGRDVFTNLACFNANGRIIAATDTKHIGVEMPDESGFIIGMQGRAIITDVTYSILSGDFTINIYAPIQSIAIEEITGQKTLGVLNASLNWEDIHNIINDVTIDNKPLRPSAYPILINRDGVVLFAPDFAPEKGSPLKMDLTKWGLQSVNMVLEGKSGYLIEKKQGRDTLIGYARSKSADKIKDLRWSVLIMQDMDEAMIPVATLQRDIMAVGFIEFLIILAAALFFSYRITAPIIELTLAAKHISEGKDIQVSVKSKDELKELADSFNAMVSHLKESKEATEIYAGGLKEKTLQLETSQKELQTKLKELEKFHRFVIDRELRMVELKKEIKQLKEGMMREDEG